VINGRDRQRLEGALHELEALGAVSGVAGDASRDDEVEHIVREALRALGRIDVLVNSAGIDGGAASPLDLTPEGWRRVLEVNLTGPFLMARGVGRHMAAAGGGAIVNVASLYGLAAEPNF